MSDIAMHWLWWECTAEAKDLPYLAAIAWRATDTGYASFSTAELARMVRQSPKTVHAAINRLVRHRHLDVKFGQTYDDPDEYQLRMTVATRSPSMHRPNPSVLDHRRSGSRPQGLSHDKGARQKGDRGKGRK